MSSVFLVVLGTFDRARSSHHHDMTAANFNLAAGWSDLYQAVCSKKQMAVRRGPFKRRTAYNQPLPLLLST